MIEFELGNEALLVPQPDHKPIVWLSSLYPKKIVSHDLVSYRSQTSSDIRHDNRCLSEWVKILTRVKRKLVSFSSEYANLTSMNSLATDSLEVSMRLRFRVCVS